MVLIFYILTKLVIPKTSYTKIIKEFYKEPKDSLDVVFVGDSSIYKGVSPMQLWHEHGIASYNYASPTQRVWDSYYCVKEVLNYQKPKVIVMDTNQIFREDPTTPEYQRHLYDNVKMGKPKLEGISNKIQGNDMKKVFSYIFPITRFHSRWSELKDNDFALYEGEYPYVFKGYMVVNKTKPFIQKNKNKRKGNDVIGENVLFYLEEIKKETDKNNVKFVLISVPNPKTWNDNRRNQITQWANMHNVEFIDLNGTSKINIDWNQDTEDEGTHLNWKGAKKNTYYLGNHLVTKYKLTNHKKEEQYKDWLECEKKYEEYIRKINNQ